MYVYYEYLRTTLIEVLFSFSGPLGSVSGISVQRGETSMMVSWNQMSLSEARGFPFYFVYLYGSAGSTGRTTREDKLIKQLRTNETTATFEGLDPDTSYSVQVQPATGGGNGTLSDFREWDIL